MSKVMSPMSLWGLELSEAEMWALIESAGELLERLEVCEKALQEASGSSALLEGIRATIARAKGQQR